MSIKVAVIGGGAAGLMAAGTAGQNGANVTVIESQPRPARKLMITGKGRCNVTNKTDINGLVNAVRSNQRFLYSAFSAFSAEDTMSFFEQQGVRLKVERGNRVFPVSDKSSDIVDALTAFARKNSEIITAKAEKILTADGAVTGVQLKDGRTLECDRVILATGGKSYPVTGSTGDGYEMAHATGHTVTELRPSLVGLNIYEGFCERVMGLTLKNIEIKVFENDGNKPVYTDFGELLFTHFGVSGPVILSASAHMKNLGKSNYRITVDLKPALDTETLDARILRDFSQNSNKNFENSLDALLPKKLIPVIVKLCGIPADTKVNQITQNQRRTLCGILKNLELHITGARPIEEAVITAGGVSVRDIDPKTMESKRCRGLYFAGEIIDVDAYTGGFNLQIAFSTGRLAGLSVSEGL